MKCSEDQKELVQALLKARQSFPKITKSKEGQSGNRKFKYTPLDEVFDAVMPHLYANGLLLTQGTDGHDLVTRLDHVTGQWRETRMPLNEEHANMQSYGIELTYRRRYAIQPMLGIITEDDNDSEGGQQRGGVNFSPITASDVNRQAFESLPPEIQHRLRKKSPAIDAAALTSGQKAKEMVDDSVSDYEEDMRIEVKQGLWYLLDTKTKTAIRKVVV